jgi:hypothetical protein
MARIRPNKGADEELGAEERAGRYTGIDNNNNIVIQWGQLFTDLGMGIIVSVFVGITGAFKAFFGSLSLLIERAAAGATATIETAAGQSHVIDAAWTSATNTVGSSGIGGFAVGIVVAGGAWLVVSTGVSILVE